MSLVVTLCGSYGIWIGDGRGRLTGRGFVNPEEDYLWEKINIDLALTSAEYAYAHLCAELEWEWSAPLPVAAAAGMLRRIPVAHPLSPSERPSSPVSC